MAVADAKPTKEDSVVRRAIKSNKIDAFLICYVQCVLTEVYAIKSVLRVSVVKSVSAR